MASGKTVIKSTLRDMYEQAILEVQEEMAKKLSERDEKHQLTMRERDEIHQSVIQERDEKHQSAMREQGQEMERCRQEADTRVHTASSQVQSTGLCMLRQTLAHVMKREMAMRVEIWRTSLHTARVRSELEAELDAAHEACHQQKENLEAMRLDFEKARDKHNEEMWKYEEHRKEYERVSNEFERMSNEYELLDSQLQEEKQGRVQEVQLLQKQQQHEMRLLREEMEKEFDVRINSLRERNNELRKECAAVKAQHEAASEDHRDTRLTLRDLRRQLSVDEKESSNATLHQPPVSHVGLAIAQTMNVKGKLPFKYVHI